MSQTTINSETLRKVMSQLGRSGRGQSKIRGTSEYYRKIAAISVEKRRLKKSKTIQIEQQNAGLKKN